jgi:hypothetical protein
MTLSFDHSENALFEYYSDQDISMYLWEMYQCWMLELSQLDKTHLDVSNRQYFFELLAAHISKQQLLDRGKTHSNQIAQSTIQETA